jgi:hypothetical protein
MNNNTEIANAALTEVGADLLTDLDSDTTTRARIVQKWFSHTRDSLLRRYTWNFALARQALSRDATAPVFEFTYSFSLPTNPYCIRALEMYNSTAEWKVEGRKLLTDDSSVNLKYIARVTNPVEFDDLFTDAFVFKLASNIAFPIMRDKVLARELLAVYESKLSEAITADSREGTFNVMRNNVLIGVRHGISSPPTTPVSGVGTARND